MKRIFLALPFCAFTLATFSSAAPALAASGANPLTTITLTDPAHQQIDGKFLDDSLATELAPDGSLGSPLFNLTAGSHIWVIDPQLVEEVQAMSKGYSLVNGSKPQGQVIAQAWLDRLKVVTSNSSVYAMAYSNPSEYWVNRLSPHQKNYILTLSQNRLTALLGTPVLLANEYQSNNDFSLKDSEIVQISNDSHIFEMTAAYIDPALIDTYRLDLIKVLNPHLTPTVREYLVNDLTNTANEQAQLIHLSLGKFTVTSTTQKLPITITNGFPTAVSVNLSISAANARVSLPETVREKLPAKSKTQILLPIHVYSSGSSSFNVRITNAAGDLLGTPIDYPLTLSVISPVATWITTGAAILLFVAASIQSIRRIRKRGQKP